MHAAMTGSTQPAKATARSGGTPNISKAGPRSSGLVASCSSKKFLALARRLPDLGEVVPLEVDVPDRRGVRDPRAHQVGPGADHAHDESAAPVVAHQVDGALRREHLELGDQPRHVFLLGGAEPVRSRPRETGELGSDDVPRGELGSEVLPDSGRLGDAMDEDRRHAGSMAAAWVSAQALVKGTRVRRVRPCASVCSSFRNSAGLEP